jgi:hypothetical protein
MDIEDLHKVVVQGFASVNDRIDSLDGRIDSLDAKVDARFAALEVHMDAEFGRVKDAFLEHGRQLISIRDTLARKVDRDELGARR